MARSDLGDSSDLEAGHRVAIDPCFGSTVTVRELEVTEG
jgi:hypothetical protein